MLLLFLTLLKKVVTDEFKRLFGVIFTDGGAESSDSKFIEF